MMSAEDRQHQRQPIRYCRPMSIHTESKISKVLVRFRVSPRTPSVIREPACITLWLPRFRTQFAIAVLQTHPPAPFTYPALPVKTVVFSNSSMSKCLTNNRKWHCTIRRSEIPNSPSNVCRVTSIFDCECSPLIYRAQPVRPFNWTFERKRPHCIELVWFYCISLDNIVVNY